MTLKLRKRSLFPALVTAESPITLTKNGAVYDFSLNINELETSLDQFFLSATYTPPYDGAVARSITDKLNEVISLQDFGCVCNGVTNDIPAFNKAIAYANSVGNIAIIVPTGTTLLNSSPTAITANNVFLVGEGSPQDCIIKCTVAGLQWSTTSVAIDGGGMINIGLDGDGGINDAAIILPQAARIRFDNIHLRSGVAQLAQIGSVSAGTTSNQISFTRLRGVVANVAAPLIQALNGSGLFVSDFDVFVNTSLLSQASGRHFVSFSQGNWDTAAIGVGIAQLFDSPVAIIADAGKVVQNIEVHGSFFDQNLQGISANATGTIYSLRVTDNEITALGTSGIGINCVGAGTQIGHMFHGNRIIQADHDGIFMSATSRLFSIESNHIYGVNRAVGAYDGIKIAGGAVDFILSDNIIGVDVSAILGTIPGQPAYGISTGANCDRFAIIGNDLRGLAGKLNLNLTGLTDYLVVNNRGIADVRNDFDTLYGDSSTSIPATARIVIASTAFTAARTMTLPAASAYRTGHPLSIYDWNASNGANTLTIAAAVGETIDGVASVTLPVGRWKAMLVTEGNNAWQMALIPAGNSASAIRTSLGLGTAATQDTGTSGAVVPLLNGANTHSGVNTFSDTTDSSSPTTGSNKFSGGVGIAKKLFAKLVYGYTDTAYNSEGQVNAYGATDPNKQVWFGYDTSTDRGFMQAVKQGTGFKPILLNALGGNVVVGSNSDGANTLDVTGTIGATSSIKSTSSSAGIGYATGAGGTVTQITSKTTGVTLNKVCGQITMNNAALASGVVATFTLTNSAIAATDIVHVHMSGGGTVGSYFVMVDSVSAGSCQISVRNYSGGSLSEAIVLNFNVIKGVAA